MLPTRQNKQPAVQGPHVQPGCVLRHEQGAPQRLNEATHFKSATRTIPNDSTHPARRLRPCILFNLRCGFVSPHGADRTASRAVCCDALCWQKYAAFFLAVHTAVSREFCPSTPAIPYVAPKQPSLPGCRLCVQERSWDTNTARNWRRGRVITDQGKNGAPSYPYNETRRPIFWFGYFMKHGDPESSPC